jgi:tetratricopeptide (TPR) repeat protein
MDQLSLFPAAAERPGAPVAELPSADEASPDPVVGGTSQMGLFDARVRELRAVRQAIASGALDEALYRLPTVEAGPDFDPSAARERVSRISAQISEAGRSAGQESAAMLAMLGRRLGADGEPWSSLGRVLVLRAAAVVEDGPGSLAGRLYQEAGELDRARSVLASALARARSASLLFALGDVETLRGQSTAARRWYRDALLLDPFDAAFESVLDGDTSFAPGGGRGGRRDRERAARMGRGGRDRRRGPGPACPGRCDDVVPA